MEFLPALKLLGFFIGATLQFSLLVLIKRYRPLHKPEALFLGLAACLCLWNSCNFLLLLIENLGAATPMSRFFLSLGIVPLAFCALAAIPSLLLHSHLAMRQSYLQSRSTWLGRLGEAAIYLPLLFLPSALLDFMSSYPSQSILVGSFYARPFASWFSLALLTSAALEGQMLAWSHKQEERRLLRVMIAIFLLTAVLVVYAYWVVDYQELWNSGFESLLMLWPILPSALLAYTLFRYNLLEIAVPRTLGYCFAAVLFLMVYLLLIRWVRDALEIRFGFPGVAVDAAMVLALFAFSQPIRRWIDSSVDALFSLEISKFKTLASRLDEASRSAAEVDKLLRHIEELLQRELEIERLKIVLYPEVGQERPHPALPNSDQQGRQTVPLSQGGAPLGEIQAGTDLGQLSRQQQAGLQFLAPQIVAAIENCKMMEGKILLERELAERDKLASLGQMAATVAHNIKNPLSSIKTIVQLMQEDPEVNLKHAHDLSMVNSEIDRLSASVTQLLKFSKPVQGLMTCIDLNAAVERAVEVFGAEASQKGIKLQIHLAPGPLTISGTDEILSEVLQNLIVNALEVSPPSGCIFLQTLSHDEPHSTCATVRVEDQGPGITPEIREHIFKPFFTTKQKGTGLGLAVVYRRVLDLGGRIDCLSPLTGKGGTRFELVFPRSG